MKRVWIFFIGILAVSVAMAFSQNYKSDFYLKKARSQTFTPEERCVYYDSVIANADKTNKTRFRLEKAQFYDDYGSYSDENLEIEKALKEDGLNTNLIPRLQLMRSKSLLHAGRFDMATKEALSLIDRQLPDSVLPLKVQAWTVMSDLFMQLGNLDLSKECASEAEKFLSILTNDKKRKFPADEMRKAKIRVAYSNMNINILEHQYDDAYKYLKQAEKYARTSEEKATNLARLALLLQVRNDWSKSAEIYEEVMGLRLLPINKAVAAYNYMQVLYELKDYNKSLNIINRFAPQIQLLFNHKLGAQYLREKAKLTYVIGDREKSIELLDSAYALNDSLSRSQSSLMTQDVSMRFENWRNTRDRNLAISNMHRKTLIIIILLIILGVSVVAFVILFIKNRKKRNKNILLKNKIETMESEHLVEITTQRDHNIKQSQELTSLSIQLAQLHESFNQIKALCTEKKYTDREIINQIKLESKKISTQDNLWKIYEHYFNDINPSFFERLRYICPKLTTTEKRLCALMLMNLQTKEIANFTGRSWRTVQTIKMNIRKKLGITDKTEDYIMFVASASDAEIEQLKARADYFAEKRKLEKEQLKEAEN